MSTPTPLINMLNLSFTTRVIPRSAYECALSSKNFYFKRVQWYWHLMNNHSICNINATKHIISIILGHCILSNPYQYLRQVFILCLTFSADTGFCSFFGCSCIVEDICWVGNCCGLSGLSRNRFWWPIVPTMYSVMNSSSAIKKSYIV